MSEQKESSIVKASTVVGVFATIISVVVSLFQCDRENSRQKHEIRAKYLDLALAEQGTVHERGRVLRFLKLIDDDPTLNEWASAELGTIQVYKEAEAGRLELVQDLASLKDSARIALKDSANQVIISKRFEAKQKRLFKQLDSLQMVLNRTAKEAAISTRPHGFEFADIKFEDLPIGPNCNIKSIRASDGIQKYDPECLESYGKQNFDSTVYSDKKWRWYIFIVQKWDKTWDKSWELQRLKISCECKDE